MCACTRAACVLLISIRYIAAVFRPLSHVICFQMIGNITEFYSQATDITVILNFTELVTYYQFWDNANIEKAILKKVARAAKHRCTILVLKLKKYLFVKTPKPLKRSLAMLPVKVL